MQIDTKKIATHLRSKLNAYNRTVYTLEWFACEESSNTMLSKSHHTLAAVHTLAASRGGPPVILATRSALEAVILAVLSVIMCVSVSGTKLVN